MKPSRNEFNTFLSQLAFAVLVEDGLEFRDRLIRLVRTLRYGDRFQILAHLRTSSKITRNILFAPAL